MQFKDRLDAARRLANLLEPYRNEESVIVAVSNGGIRIGCFLAREFGFPLELLLIKKLGHPFHPEFTIGAVTREDVLLDPLLDVTKEYIRPEIRRIRQELQARHETFTAGDQAIELQDKTILLVDDGIATGRTLKAAAQLLYRKQPRRLVVAVPVAPKRTALEFQDLVDDFICVHTPEDFYRIDAYYQDFRQVEDREVLVMLKGLSEWGLVV